MTPSKIDVVICGFLPRGYVNMTEIKIYSKYILSIFLRKIYKKVTSTLKARRRNGAKMVPLG